MLGVLVAGALAGIASPQPAVPEEDRVDLQLVLAVDVSGSMDLRERRFQRQGYVEAFAHPEVLEAIRSGPRGRIAVTYVEWASQTRQVVVVPWRVIGDEEEVLDFADDLARAPVNSGVRTSISGAMLFAANAFRSSGVVSERRVVDISSDGVNNEGLPVSTIRDLLVGQGITINGLPILITGAQGLDEYYRVAVIGGPGAFVIPVTVHADIIRAIRRKLVVEMAGLPAEAAAIDPTPP
jgi:hypothetical protein